MIYEQLENKGNEKYEIYMGLGNSHYNNTYYLMAKKYYEKALELK